VKRYVPTDGPLHVPDELQNSPAWKMFVTRPNSLTLGLFFDGVPCFRITNAVYSVHLVTIEVMNLPFFLRADPRFQIFTDIIPGPSKPKILKKWLMPLLADVKKGGYNLLFTSADYVAQVQLLCHSQLGYFGCCKCEMRARKVEDFYDWRSLPNTDPPPLKDGAKAITYGNNALLSSNKQYKGFRDVPIFAHVQEDCIAQSVEDALHMVEGCIYRHVFRLLKGEKKVERPGTGELWNRWLTDMASWKLKQSKQDILDQRWKLFCNATGRHCGATPCAKGGDMTGEQWSSTYSYA